MREATLDPAADIAVPNAKKSASMLHAVAQRLGGVVLLVILIFAMAALVRSPPSALR